MRPGDPNDDAGNRALDYATDNVEKKLAGMDLEELSETFDIGLFEGLEIFDAQNEWKGLYRFALALRWAAVECSAGKDEARGDEHFEVGMDILEAEDGVWTRFSEMLCTAIRANETYQQQMSEKLQEQHRAGEVDDWAGQDDAEENAREREGSR